MDISAQQIKNLREKSGGGISDIKKALEKAGGDEEKALKIIERKLGSVALKKKERITGAGLIGSYLHPDGRVASLIEVFCETDFVARNPDFKAFAHDLAMQVAAMNPKYLSLETVPAEEWEEEKARAEQEAKKLQKTADIIKQVVEGKLKTSFGSVSLLSQAFVKDPDKSVADLIKEVI